MARRSPKGSPRKCAPTRAPSKPTWARAPEGLSMALLELQGVDTYYGRVQALHQVSMTIDEGEIVTLIGSNGAGNTTTLPTISGLTHPAKGHVRLRGKEISGLPPDRIVSLGIGHAPEGRRIFHRMTVRDNLFLGAYSRNDGPPIRADQEKVFQLFPLLRERRQQIGGIISGGGQQLIALRRVLMSRPIPGFLRLPPPGFGPR